MSIVTCLKIHVFVDIFKKIGYNREKTGTGGSRTMVRALKYAILGLLSQESCSGYDLSLALSGALQEFWSANHSQIYPELKRLSEEGLVNYQVEISGNVLERKVYSLRRGNMDDALERIGTVMVKLFAHLNELNQSGEEFPGYSTGLRDLDRRINGLNKSDLIILAARPGMGKTTIALNILSAVAKKTQKTVAFFSLEMSREQLATRLLANESFVENQKLITGRLNDDDWEKISLAGAALSQTDIRVDDNPSITVAEMNALCRRLDNLGLVVVDYLQLMTSSGYGRQSDNRVQLIGDISRSLKIMAKELNVPVLCLSQLSRAAESRPDKRPLLSDLRESGAIEQDADQVLLLYRDDYYNKESPDKNIAEVIVAKNRHGEQGTVRVQWLPQFFTFSDLDERHAE